MAEIKITSKIIEPGHVGKIKKVRPGHCQMCGGLLTDPKSIALGYGRRCAKNRPVMIILQIPGGSKT